MYENRFLDGTQEAETLSNLITWQIGIIISITGRSISLVGVGDTVWMYPYIDLHISLNDIGTFYF